jgi:hypothetical protein
MRIDNDWLLENLSGSYSLGAVDDALDSLIGEYDALVDKISDDKRNYMMEAVSTMKDKIITSRVENVLELIDSAQFADGDEFRTIGDPLVVVAKRYKDGTTGEPAWTIEKITQEMEGVFEAKNEVLTAAVPGGYSNAVNTLTKKELAESSNAIQKNSNDISVPFATIQEVAASNDNGIINITDFVNRYIPTISEQQIDLIKLTIDNSLKNIVISMSEVSFIEHAMTDGELKGSGSKITDYMAVSAASPASSYKDTVHIVLNYENDYTINVGGVDYTYTASDFDTAEDIAAGLSDELGNDTNLSISTDTGYWSKVFENGAGDKVFGWYALNSDDSLAYEVGMIVPSDEHDLTIEQDSTNPEKIIITFEHDGFDPVYPTIGDIRDLVNSFEDVDIRVVVMPGFDPGDEYSVADDVELEIGASMIIIEASSDQTVTVSTAEDKKYIYTHVDDFSAASDQIGTVEVIKFNPSNTYFIDIDGTQIDVDPSEAGNEIVIDEPSLAQRFASLINNANLNATASVNSSLITLTSASAGTSFTVSTSGEFNYVTPIERDTLLRYDLRNLPNVNNDIIMQLKKSGTVITSNREPLSKHDISRIISSGMVFSSSAMMMPQVPQLTDNTNNFVPGINQVSGKLESIVRKEAEKIENAEERISPVRRSMTEAIFPIYSTPQAKSNRWFFVEAGANSIAAKSTIGVALSTISPRDFERLVLQDTDATFSTALENRLPNVGQYYESITSLLTEEVASYNSTGLKAIIPISSYMIKSSDMMIIKRDLTQAQIDGFINYALLPGIVRAEEESDVDGSGVDGSGVDGSDVDGSDMDGFISSPDPDELYTSLMELAIQMDDGLREQRFIALAGAYVIDASKLTSFYSDEFFADFVFGVNEVEAAPEDNYGIGGIPIDGTVTMSKLYFRNMRNQALTVPPKSFSLGQEVTLGELLTEIVPNVHILDLIPPESRVWRVQTYRYHYDYIELSKGATYDAGDCVHFGLGDQTDVEDRLYKEIARTGYFSSHVDLGINHSSSCFSKRFKESIWAILADAIEIADDGSIISLNSARAYMQSLYHSFDGLSKIELAMMMLRPSVFIDVEYEEQDNIYSPIVTIFLKILLYFKDKKDSIGYADWQTNFDKLVGKILEADEFATDLLPYDAFLAWVAGVGAHNAFTWSSDIVTDVTNIYATSGYEAAQEKRFRSIIEYGGTGGGHAALSASDYTATWSVGEVDGNLLPQVVLETV